MDEPEHVDPALMDFPHGKSLTVRSTTTTTDPYGDTVAETVESTWGPCAVAPRYATESVDPRSAPLVVGLTVYGPAVELDEDDQVIVDGITYDVEGLPGVWESPFTGWAPGIEVNLKRAG